MPTKQLHPANSHSNLKFKMEIEQSISETNNTLTHFDKK